MTKLRSRLLTTLVLTAVCVSALGVGNASAKKRLRESPTTTSSTKTIRPVASPYSGEPDAGNGTAPKSTASAACALRVDANWFGSGEWLLQFWALWMARR